VTGHEDKYKEKFQKIVAAKIAMGKLAAKTKREKIHGVSKRHKKTKLIDMHFSPLTNSISRRSGKGHGPLLKNMRAMFIIDKIDRPDPSSPIEEDIL
jgi:non-homologous end joining protein Ku